MASQTMHDAVVVQNLIADLEVFEAVEIANICNGMLGVVIDRNADGACDTRDTVLSIMEAQPGFIRMARNRGSCELYETLWFWKTD